MTTLPDRLDVDISYPRVQQFYGSQMQFLDATDIEAYAATFTEDAEFAHSPGRPPSRTRVGIIEDLRDFHSRIADDPMQRRHLFTMIRLEPSDDGSTASTAYCLVLKVRPGVPPVMVSCVVHDVLVELAGEYFVRSRYIEYD